MLKKNLFRATLAFFTFCFFILSPRDIHSQSGDWGINGNPNVDSTAFIGTLDAVGLKFKTDASERMIITPTGNIGIGLSNPAEKLSVSGNIQSLNLAGTDDRMVIATPGGNLVSGPSFSSLTGVLTGGGTIATCPSSVWLTAGNNGGALCRLGTLDYFPVNIISNGQSRIRLKADGMVSIGDALWSSTSQFQANTLTEGFSQHRHFLGLNAQYDPVQNQIGILYPNTAVYYGHGAGMDMDDQSGKLKIGVIQNGLHNLKGITIGIDGHMGVGMEPELNATTSIITNLHYFSLSGNGFARFTEPENENNAIYLGHDGQNSLIERYGTGHILMGYHSGANVVVDNDLQVTENAYFQNRVMIGCTSSTDNGTNYALNVNGKVRTLAVKVYTSWADYVFDSTYVLPSLSEVESFIATNHHLPGVPSASEIEKEGVDLGGMEAKLMEKIEELTLYAIRQEKEIGELKKAIRDYLSVNTTQK